MTTRAGYRTLFVHADQATQEDITLIRSSLPNNPNVSDAVRIALRFTAKKLTEQGTSGSGGDVAVAVPTETAQ